MASFFNETQYLNNKVKQLAAANEKDPNGNPYTPETVKAAMAASGMSPEEHYSTFGRGEKLNPNSYFNESEYLSAKLKALQETDPTWVGKSTDDVAKAMAEAGLTPAEHYETIGAFETTKDGSLLNPSNAFDANAYFAAKLAQLIATNHPGATEMTVAQLVNIVKEAGFSPVSHYVACGAGETADGVALVQTVPVTQRVANDPNRAVLGDNVPSNYNPATPGATTPEAKPGAVTKPADMGGMADKTVSPEVKAPSTPVKVEGDQGYVPPPDNIKDTNDKPVVIVPGKDGDSFGVLDPDTGNVNGINPDGSVSDEVIGKDDGSGNITPPPSGGGGDGGDGGGTIPPAPTGVELTHTLEANALDVNAATSVNANIELKFKDNTAKINLVLDDNNSGGSVKLSTELAAEGMGAITSMDLAGVTVAQDKFVTIDLTLAETKVTGLTTVVGTTSTSTGGAITGGDIIKVESAQISGSGKLKGTDASTPGIDAGAGDDILVVTDTVSGNYAFGHMHDVETVVTTVSVTANASLDYTNVIADAGKRVTGLIHGTGTPTNCELTTTKIDELMLDNLTLAKLVMNNAGDVIIEAASTDITALSLANGSGTGLELSMAGTNTIGLANKAALGAVTTVTITNFDGTSDVHNILKITAGSDKTDDVVTLKIGAADLLAGSVTYNGTGYTGKFEMDLGFSGAAANLSTVSGLDVLDMGAFDSTVTVGTSVYTGNAENELTIISSSADATITLSAGGKDTIQLNATGKDTITGFASGDLIDVKTTLGISGGSVVSSGADTVADRVKLNICTVNKATPSDAEAKTAIDASFTGGSLQGITSGAVFAITFTDNGNADNNATYIYRFTDGNSDGLTADTELALIGVVNGALTGSDFVAA